MENQLLFVVPVYASNEAVFHGRWQEKMDSLRNCEGAAEEAGKLEKFPWKYNQIVAMVEFYKYRDGIEYQVYKRLGNIHFCHVPRREMVLVERGGNRFRIFENDTNKSIREKILKHLNGLVKYELKGRHLDLELFESQFKLMNVRGLFN